MCCKEPEFRGVRAACAAARRALRCRASRRARRRLTGRLWWNVRIVVTLPQKVLRPPKFLQAAGSAGRAGELRAGCTGGAAARRRRRAPLQLGRSLEDGVGLQHPQLRLDCCLRVKRAQVLVNQVCSQARAQGQGRGGRRRRRAGPGALVRQGIAAGAAGRASGPGGPVPLPPAARSRTRDAEGGLLSCHTRCGCCAGFCGGEGGNVERMQGRRSRLGGLSWARAPASWTSAARAAQNGRWCTNAPCHGPSCRLHAPQARQRRPWGPAAAAARGTSSAPCKGSSRHALTPRAEPQPQPATCTLLGQSICVLPRPPCPQTACVTSRGPPSHTRWRQVAAATALSTQVCRWRWAAAVVCHDSMTARRPSAC